MYRSDVIGSLLRPAYLKKAREDFAAQRLTDAEFKCTEDRAVDESVALQLRAGLDVLTDGEMRRYAFYGHMIDAFEGFDKFGGWSIPFRDDKGEVTNHPRPVVVSKLRRKWHMCAEEFTYLRARTDHTAKTTLLSAQQAAAYYDSKKSSGAYPTVDSFLADLVDLLRGEVAELVRLGCTYIQVDSPQYAALIDANIREGYRQRGNDPDRLLDLSIEMDNAVIGGHPNVTFGLHLCRGNNQSKFYASGDYAPIAKVFRNTKFQRFLLEFDDERSGGFEPLSHVPSDRTVVLGLISTKKAPLEAKDEIKSRIHAAEKFVPLERLALSPQCGFASTLEGNLLSEADQEAKLRRVAEIAREVWGDAKSPVSSKVKGKSV
ncbi:MAG TPA: cobalamin-independent methionine synthase II family protein [Candidatus Acidoferrales bacterium]|jgi:5-methyltetrahydropteroyltriglutamate--homocysteine methyltransferase|nr:cobalamin-independent methionine synthase II family protein [Candidatus Acidoferrales bacterium]